MNWIDWINQRCRLCRYLSLIISRLVPHQYKLSFSSSRFQVQIAANSSSLNPSIAVHCFHWFDYVIQLMNQWWINDESMMNNNNHVTLVNHLKLVWTRSNQVNNFPSCYHYLTVFIHQPTTGSISGWIPLDWFDSSESNHQFSFYFYHLTASFLSEWLSKLGFIINLLSTTNWNGWKWFNRQFSELNAIVN